MWESLSFTHIGPVAFGGAIFSDSSIIINLFFKLFREALGGVIASHWIHALLRLDLQVCVLHCLP